MRRLIPKSAITGKERVKDSLRDRIKNENAMWKKDPALLETAKNVWMGMDSFRKNRLRNIRYVFGNQWGDMVRDSCGNIVSEYDRLSKSMPDGVVLQNNIIFSKINALVGLYLEQGTEYVCFARHENADRKGQMMTNAIMTNYDINEMSVLMKGELLEMLIGGLPVSKELWSTHDDSEDAFTFFVNPNYFFFRSKGADPRPLWDCDLMGEIVDYTRGELAARLAHSTYDYAQLMHIYGDGKDSEMDSFDADREDRHNQLSWETPSANNLCRTYQIWTYEHKLRYRIYDPLDMEQPTYIIDVEDLDEIKWRNEQRIKEYLQNGFSIDEVPQINYGQIKDDELVKSKKIGPIYHQYWHFEMLSPEGYVLEEYDSPYDHKGTPYVFHMSNYINGQFYPFVNVLRDPQRHVNRLISQYDMGLQKSIKGLTFMPKPFLGKKSAAQAQEEMHENGNMFVWEPNEDFPDLKPEFVNTAPAVNGIIEMLNIQNSYGERSSGVNEAIQGQKPNGGTPASLYAMQYQNASKSLSSALSDFDAYERNVARKKMKVIHQYYQDPRNISLQHSNGYASYGMYDPKAVQDIDFWVSIKRGTSSPVERMKRNEQINRLVEMKALTPKQGLKLGVWEGGMEDVIQALDANEEAAQQDPNMRQESLSQPEQMPRQGSVEQMENRADRMMNGY